MSIHVFRWRIHCVEIKTVLHFVRLRLWSILFGQPVTFECKNWLDEGPLLYNFRTTLSTIFNIQKCNIFVVFSNSPDASEKVDLMLFLWSARLVRIYSLTSFINTWKSKLCSQKRSMSRFPPSGNPTKWAKFAFSRPAFYRGNYLKKSFC